MVPAGVRYGQVLRYAKPTVAATPLTAGTQYDVDIFFAATSVDYTDVTSATFTP
jgi:hypothetical protein